MLQYKLFIRCLDYLSHYCFNTGNHGCTYALSHVCYYWLALNTNWLSLITRLIRPKKVYFKRNYKVFIDFEFDKIFWCYIAVIVEYLKKLFNYRHMKYFYWTILYYIPRNVIPSCEWILLHEETLFEESFHPRRRITPTFRGRYLRSWTID